MAKEFNWQTLEFQYQEKNGDWFWALGIIAVAGAAAAFLLNNILFGILILIGSFVIAIYGSQRPKLIAFSITDRGIRVGRKLYPFQNLKSFWIEDRFEGRPVLLLQETGTFTPLISVPIENEAPEEIRLFLLERLSEEEHDISLSERIMEMFGF